MAEKAYIVTGSSSGIGFNIAQALVREGHRVVVHGSSRPKVEEAARQLGKVPALVADLQEVRGGCGNRQFRHCRAWTNRRRG